MVGQSTLWRRRDEGPILQPLAGQGQGSGQASQVIDSAWICNSREFNMTVYC